MIDEVEKIGGMEKAVTQGLPKLRIEQAAAQRQARFDNGQELVVGVNRYLRQEDSEISKVNVREIDNHAVLTVQIEKLQRLRATRDQTDCHNKLDALRKAAENKPGGGENNLLSYAIACARARATIGEISKAIEDVYGRYKASPTMISGVYGNAYQDRENWRDLLARTAQFAKQHGRHPRIMIVKMGQDGHDRGAKIIASAFADAGFDVDIGPLFQTPQEVARDGIINDVHVIGVSQPGRRT